MQHSIRSTISGGLIKEVVLVALVAVLVVIILVLVFSSADGSMISRVGISSAISSSSINTSSSIIIVAVSSFNDCDTTNGSSST